MLYLSRRVGDSIVINDQITITVTEVRGKTVKLGFDSPQGTRVLRKEIYDKINAENQAAANAINLIKRVIP